MRGAAAVRDICLAMIPFLGIAWAMDLPLHGVSLARSLGLTLADDFAIQIIEYVLVIAGLAVAGGFLVKPYGQRLGVRELTLALIGLAAWWWAAWNYDDWLLDAANRGPEKWMPGAVGIALMIEGMRRNCGLAITLLVIVFVVYGLVGHWLPGALEATRSPPPRYVLYLYSDANAVPGIVMRVGATIVLAFILMGKVMELSGASAFFNDGALSLMGARRGGPAKVAIVSSSVFGTVNGTTVGNIMSTGIVTIPLMKRTGFPPHYAGAIEAVASNGGQLAPPVMGTTAFLIAEFLQIDYAEVALAAIMPALIYYIVLFIQVDRFAQNSGLTGIARSELPRGRQVLAAGWVFLIPLALLMTLLFYYGYNAAKSALYTAALMLALGAVRNWRILRPGSLREILVGAGENLIPLLLVCGGAGIVIGVLNISGLGLQLVIVLEQVAAQAGFLVMLIATAAIAIILGMGMPTSAVYVVLSVVLAPALVKLGVAPMPAHLFIFYFGLLSMLTPPVAVASFVAAGLAGSNMWRTGVTGLKLAAAAYLLPFLFVYNPALIGQGSTLAVVIAAVTAIVSGGVLAYAVEGVGRNGAAGYLTGGTLFLAAIAIGGASVWFGSENLAALIPAGLALAGWAFFVIHIRPRAKALSERTKQKVGT